jgi:site-specific recombinase XerD
MALKLPKIVPQKDVGRMLHQINLNCPTGARNYAIMIMMYRAGLRIQEVCNLGLSDINFDNGLIYVQQSKGREGKKKDRYVPMDDDIVNSLQSWLLIRPSGQYFFCTLQGGQLDQRYIREVCYRISKKAGVFIKDGSEMKKVSPHKLRHSFATEVLREGTCNIRDVQELLGHGDLSSTMVYTHVVLEDLQSKIKKRKGMAQG